jgi:hypothetical protein
MLQSAWSEAAACVEAVGTIGAVIGAAWVASAESRASRKREERTLAEAGRAGGSGDADRGAQPGYTGVHADPRPQRPVA